MVLTLAKFRISVSKLATHESQNIYLHENIDCETYLDSRDTKLNRNWTNSNFPSLLKSSILYLLSFSHSIFPSFVTLSNNASTSIFPLLQKLLRTSPLQYLYPLLPSSSKCLKIVSTSAYHENIWSFRLWIYSCLVETTVYWHY